MVSRMGGFQRKRCFESEIDGFSSTTPNTAQQQQKYSSVFEQKWCTNNVTSQFPPTPVNHRKNDRASHAAMILLLFITIAIVSAVASASKNTINDSSIDDNNTTQVDNREVPSSDRIFSSKNESESDVSSFVVELDDSNDEESSATMSVSNDDEGMKLHCMRVTYFKIH